MINLIPQTETEEIMQNIKTILSTYKGTVPLMRDFGIDPNLIDNLQTDSFKQKLKNDVIKQIEKYEPRAKVNKIKLYTQEEKLYINLNLAINEAQYELKYTI